MIAIIEGRVHSKSAEGLIIMVGGIGVRVLCTQPTLALARPGEEIVLYTHLIVREDDLTLVGFGSEEELGLFENLMRVQGVGPRLALSVLSFMAPDALRLAIGQEHPELLARVPGIGKKTAQKIVLELKDKIGAGEVSEGLAAITEADAAVIDALTALGYSIVEAQRAVQALPREVTDVEERLRRALASFGS